METRFYEPYRPTLPCVLRRLGVLAVVLLWWIATESLGAAGQSPSFPQTLAAPTKGTEAESPAAAGETDFDINKLADRLRASSAIGTFTKLALKNEVTHRLMLAEALATGVRKFFICSRRKLPHA